MLDDNNSLKSEVAERDGALKEVEGVLAKRAEQCRQLYDIVGILLLILLRILQSELSSAASSTTHSRYFTTDFTTNFTTNFTKRAQQCRLLRDTVGILLLILLRILLRILELSSAGCSATQ